MYNFIQKTTQYENNDEQIGKNNNQLNTLFPKEPNSEWIQHLEGLHISKVACAGQHTFVISNGTKISHKIGHSLLRECKLYSKHLKDVTESNQGNVSCFMLLISGKLLGLCVYLILIVSLKFRSSYHLYLKTLLD